MFPGVSRDEAVTCLAVFEQAEMPDVPFTEIQESAAIFFSPDGIVDLNELGVAADLYQRKKDRRKFACLQTTSIVLAFLATAFIMAFAIQSAQQVLAAINVKWPNLGAVVSLY